MNREIKKMLEEFYENEKHRGDKSWSPGLTSAKPLVDAIVKELERKRTENVIEFRKKMKEQAPAEIRYVTVGIFTDGSDGFIEYSENLNGYEVLGILEWGKSLKLADTEGE